MTDTIELLREEIALLKVINAGLTAEVNNWKTLAQGWEKQAVEAKKIIRMSMTEIKSIMRVDE